MHTCITGTYAAYACRRIPECAAPPETGLPGSRAAAPENTANAPFPPEAPQAARAQPPTKLTAKTKMPRAAVHARGAESNRKEERTFPMKPQYFDSQKAAAIISEPNDDRRSLMVDALTGDEAKLLCKLLLEFVPRKGAQKVRIRTIH